MAGSTSPNVYAVNAVSGEVRVYSVMLLTEQHIVTDEHKPAGFSFGGILRDG